MGQSIDLRAPLGYTKIKVDLRQTPADLERVPNLDYVYICYKTDKHLAQAERDLLIFRRLFDLEQSKIAKDTPEHKGLEESRKFLEITYNLDLLLELSRTMKESLLGPLGDYYLDNSKDVLYDICEVVWSQYILPVL